MAQKKYAINWEDDEPVSSEVDGVLYERVDQIPDEADREKITAMMDASFDQQFEEEFREFDREIEKDWEAHKKTSANAQKIILGAFTGVAVLMLLIAAISSFRAVLKMSTEESASGRVVEIIQRREYVNEQPFHEVGDEVTVLHNPDYPLEARIKSFGSYALLWVLPSITGLLGFGFLGAVLTVHKLMPSSETA